MNKILIVLFLIMPVFAVEDLMLSENQILSYEIPPSAYLEKLAEISEKKAVKRQSFVQRGTNFDRKFFFFHWHIVFYKTLTNGPFEMGLKFVTRNVFFECLFFDTVPFF